MIEDSKSDEIEAPRFPLQRVIAGIGAYGAAAEVVGHDLEHLRSVRILTY